MPERTFGRTVRSRRTKLGLSQAKLAELVGRSASTVRSWERDKTHPTDTGVITALAAILGADERQLFERAGQAMPDQEESPTIEQSLATLKPEPKSDLPEVADEPPSAEEAEPDLEGAEPDVEESQTIDERPTIEESPTIEEALATLSPELVPDLSVEELESDDEPTPVEQTLASLNPEPETELPFEESASEEELTPVEFEQDMLADLSPDDDDQLDIGAAEAPAYNAPAETYVTVAPAASSVGSSYMDDRSQRQLYLVRNLATIVVLVGLVVALLWALTESMTAIGDWWDEFFGNLRL